MNWVMRKRLKPVSAWSNGPERMADLLPTPRLDVEIAIGSKSTDRLVTIHGDGAWSERLAGLKRRILDL